jgi:uncharacterized protein (TIGR03437 family)
LVNIAGSDLASKDVHWSPAADQPLPTTLGGVTVKVNGAPAVLSHVSPAQITMLVPAVTPEGDLPVVIEREGQSSDTVTVTSRAALPALHSVAETTGDERRYGSGNTGRIRRRTRPDHPERMAARQAVGGSENRARCVPG